MSSYVHSSAFQHLKGTQEKIVANLSSHQYLSGLDKLLMQACSPIVEHTSFFEGFLAKILAWQYTNSRRKASSSEKADLATNITFFLISSSLKAKMYYLSKMKLDRGILSEGIRSWLALADDYHQVVTDPRFLEQDVEKSLLREHEFESKCQLRPGHSLFGPLQQVRLWHDRYNQFKSMILEKYTRKCLMQAQQDYEEFFKRSIQLDDIVQVYLFYAVRAIEKCDTTKGVLSTYVSDWLRHAKQQVTKQHGERTGKSGEYSIWTTVSLDNLDVDSIDLSVSNAFEENTASDILRLRQIAKIFDPLGIGRLVLGIQDVLSEKDQALLQSLRLTSYQLPTSVNRQVQ